MLARNISFQDTAFLSQCSVAFWSGKRWIAYPEKVRFFYKPLFRFFGSLMTADSFCRRSTRKGRKYRFAALADVMKQILSLRVSAVATSPRYGLSELKFHQQVLSRLDSKQRNVLATGAYVPIYFFPSPENQMGEMAPTKFKTAHRVLIARVNIKTRSLQYFDHRLRRSNPALIPGGCEKTHFDFEMLFRSPNFLKHSMQ